MAPLLPSDDCHGPRTTGNGARALRWLGCPRCGRELREVVAKNVFTKHAACGHCHILYVAWDNCLTRCMTPIRCAGELWIWLDEYNAKNKIAPTVAPSVRAKCRTK